MCLLHWLSRREGLTVHAAHFDHRLRGEESARDAGFVRDQCARWGIPFHLGSADVASAARQQGRGVEETARELRYAFLRQTAAETGAGLIATAHTAGDNAETVLMDLLRGSGLRGLGGIAPRRGDLIRPFLTTTREEILSYLDSFGIPHVEDSTNAGDGCLRNRVRHQLIPLLEEWNPGFVDRMTLSIPTLRSDEEYLTAQAWPLVQKALWIDGELVLPAPVMASAPAPVAVRLARMLLSRAAEGEGDCSMAHLDALVNLARSSDPSASINLPHGLTARREYDLLILSRRFSPPPPASFSPVFGENPVPGTDWILLLDAPPWDGLTVRPRAAGDEITLPGRPPKSLKKLFIDEKIPRTLRDRLPVCADGDGVLAVAGVGENTCHPKHGLVRFVYSKEKEEKPL